MACALARTEGSIAREIYFALPDSQRNLVETRQLAFKAALRMGDAAWAAESIELIARQAKKDPVHLYACVLDAHEIGDQGQALFALQKLLESYDPRAPRGLHLPALLRSMIRMMRQSTKNSEPPDEMQLNESMKTITHLFEEAAEHATNPAGADTGFDLQELNWFSKNSYNVALEHLETADPVLLLRLCVVCSRLIDRMERDTPALEKSNLKMRQIFCEYLAMSIMIILVRCEDDVEQSQQHYTNVMSHGKKLRGLISDQLSIQSLAESIKVDLAAKHLQGIKWELEAALRLQQWDQMSKLFEACWKYEDPKRWATLADLAFQIYEELCSQRSEGAREYNQVVLKFIEQVLNISWTPGESVVKLAKHMRCFFHLCLTTEPEFAAKCIDQVILVADQCKTVRQTQCGGEKTC